MIEKSIYTAEKLGLIILKEGKRRERKGQTLDTSVLEMAFPVPENPLEEEK